MMETPRKRLDIKLKEQKIMLTLKKSIKQVKYLDISNMFDLLKISKKDERWKYTIISKDYLVSNMRRVWNIKSNKLLTDNSKNKKISFKLNIDGKIVRQTANQLIIAAFGSLNEINGYIDILDIPDLNKISLLNEKWKYTTISKHYLVSNIGRVWSIKMCIILSSKPSKNGYIYYNIKVKGIRQKLYTGHSLVINAFIGTCPKNMVIDHIDRNRANNILENLHYVTISDNNLNKTINEKLDPKSSKKIYQMDINGNIIKLWDNVKLAAEHFNINIHTLESAAYNGSRITNGFKWRFSEPINKIDGEIWKKIIINTQVVNTSNLGRIQRGNNLPTYGSLNSHGYRRTHVLKKEYQVHCIICEAFHGPKPSPNHVVNHIDKNKQNNKSENLQWVTSKENSEHALAKSVTQYTLDKKFIQKFISITQASVKTGIDINHIKTQCWKKSKSYYFKKYIFRFSDDLEI